MNLKIGSLLLVTITTSNALVDYENYIACQNIPKSEEQVYELNDLCKDDTHKDFWTDVIKVSKHAKIMEESREYEEVTKYISCIEMKHELNIPNVLEAGDKGLKPVTGLIEGGVNDTYIKHMAEAFIWSIFPEINAGGYVYNLSKNHIWRKNRNSSYTTTCVDEVDGSSKLVDFNRNSTFVWMYEVSGAKLNWNKRAANVSEIATNNEEIRTRLLEMKIATKEMRHYSGTSSVYRSLIFIAVNALLLVVVQ